MIILRSSELLALVDPGHGAEIVELVHLGTGRRLLARPPFSTAPPRAGDLPEDVWTASYRGGWQLVAPNAGAACVVDGVEHGFHGRASNDAWKVIDSGPSAAAFTWHGHGLELTRTLDLEGDLLVARVEARATNDPAPLVVLEHIGLGLELLHPEVQIDLPAGAAFELSEVEGPPTPPKDAPTWPDVLLLDGTVERADAWSLDRPRSRLLAVAGLPEGRASVRNAVTGMSVDLEWDADWLRHLWLWHEVRTYGGPWRELTEMLAVEPTSVPHPLGLAAAREHGQARIVTRDEPATYELRLRAHVR